MAGKGFTSGHFGGLMQPGPRDPGTRSALRAALKDCLPLLKPAKTG
jgi:hypothetical protein